MGEKTKPAATAPPKARAPEKDKGGRPAIEFTPEKMRQARAMASHGLTMEQISNVLGMSKDTFERKLKAWRGAEGQDGFAAIQAARDEAIAMVAQSLYRQATGYERPVTYHPNGQPAKVEHVSANYRAAQFYLNVRAGWVEKKAVTVENGEGGPFEVVVKDYRSKKAP